MQQYSKACIRRPLEKRPKIGFQDQLLLNICQKNYRMLQGEHSAILLTFMKLPFVIKIFGRLFWSGNFTQVLLYCLKLSLFGGLSVLSVCLSVCLY